MHDWKVVSAGVNQVGVWGSGGPWATSGAGALWVRAEGVSADTVSVGEKKTKNTVTGTWLSGTPEAPGYPIPFVFLSFCFNYWGFFGGRRFLFLGKTVEILVFYRKYFFHTL